MEIEYCRVSTPHTEQIESLSNQVDYYKQMVSNHINWVLVDIYVDVRSGKNSSGRSEFQRMLEDCRNKKIDLIITKSVSRFGRNTADTLAIIRELNKEGIKSPTSKEIWPKRTIDTILSNEKYIGNVIVGKTYSKDFPYNDRKVNKGEHHKYQAANNHPPLISKWQFEQVQEEKLRRSNIHKNADRTITRTPTHYSMKSDSDINKSL